MVKRMKVLYHLHFLFTQLKKKYLSNIFCNSIRLIILIFQTNTQFFDSILKYELVNVSLLSHWTRPSYKYLTFTKIIIIVNKTYLFSLCLCLLLTFQFGLKIPYRPGNINTNVSQYKIISRKKKLSNQAHRDETLSIRKEL